MPSPSSRGQASTEYVGAVLVAGVLLAVLAAVGTASPGLTGAVVDRFKLALCVVGMDVCDAAHARSKGLEPCVVLVKERRRRLSSLVSVVRSGDGETLRIERRSDGTYVVSAGNRPQLGLTAGAGVKTGAGSGSGAGASVQASFGSGTRWEAANLDEVKRFLGDDIDDPQGAQLQLRLLKGLLPPERVTTYRELGGSAGIEAALDLDGDAGQTGQLAGSTMEVNAAIGRSTRGGVRTDHYVVDADADGPLGDRLPGVDGRRLAVAWQRTSPPVLTVTGTDPVRDGRQSETVARFVLRDPADRAMARRWVLTGGQAGDPAGRGLAARMRDAATVQRFIYADETVDEGSFGVEGKLGPLGLGLSREAELTRRTLVDARVLGLGIGGRRMDCLSD